MNSNIVLGTAQFGTGVSYDDAFAYLDYFYEHGGRIIDSAHIYGVWAEAGTGTGASERCIGAWLNARNHPPGIQIITKGAHPDFTTWEKRVDKKNILQDLNESLEHLQRNSIELYFLHRDDEDTPVAEIAECLNHAHEQGQIQSYGVSNWSLSRIDALTQYCITNNLLPPSANQIGYSIARTTPDAGVNMGTHYVNESSFAWHKQTQLPLYAFSSQAQGLFAKCGSYQDLCTHEKLGAYKTDLNTDLFEQINELSKQLHHSPVQIALAALLHSPFPCFPIIGNSNMAQLEESLAANNIQLKQEQVIPLFTQWQ